MRTHKCILTICFLLLLARISISSAQATQISESKQKPVKIGLLIPDNKSLASRQGAELAIRKANEHGGCNGSPFRLIVKSMEGPWGTGSKQAVDLVFEDKVCAIMGSPDGRNGHLIEQAAVKTRIVFLSTWASDPTLAQAFVPWYFSCVPNDLQQADVLIEEIYKKKHYSKIGAISDNGYDSKMALNSFVRRTRMSEKPDPFQIFYDDSKLDPSTLIGQIIASDIKAIILFGKPSGSMKIIKFLKEQKLNIPVFGSLSLSDEDDYNDKDFIIYENVVLVSPGNWAESKSINFRDDYKRLYGRFPGAVASYSFDGMCLLIDAIKKAGTDPGEIQKALTTIRYEGVTGIIQFDEKGKLKRKAGLMKIKNGLPEKVL
jgi:branched-chain amino acid transport system substrate-binding protein